MTGDDLTSFDKFWDNVDQHIIPFALPFTVGDQQGMLTFGFSPTPMASVALFSSNPEVRMRAMIGAARVAVSIVKEHHPHLEVHS